MDKRKKMNKTMQAVEDLVVALDRAAGPRAHKVGCECGAVHCVELRKALWAVTVELTSYKNKENDLRAECMWCVSEPTCELEPTNCPHCDKKMLPCNLHRLKDDSFGCLDCEEILNDDQLYELDGKNTIPGYMGYVISQCTKHKLPAGESFGISNRDFGFMNYCKKLGVYAGSVRNRCAAQKKRCPYWEQAKRLLVEEGHDPQKLENKKPWLRG